ncbi:MAG: pantothenate kinase [Eubacteriales bacterium]|nr:pantothenate kinase [Eubacteriales bacterium]
MGIIVGLDIGGSTTKIVGLRDGVLMSRELVHASDPIASAFGALGKFISQHQLSLDAISHVMVTGVGASYLRGDLLGIPTQRTPEFEAIGLGGLYISGLSEAVVVSMGTGTAIVQANTQGVKHLIGSGVGGGTLIGLSSRMINIRDFQTFADVAENGDLHNVDLSIGDITRDEIAGLSADTTASNFGKVTDMATQADIALGIVNLVYQSVGTSAVLAARLSNIPRIVFTGNLTLVGQGKKVLDAFAGLYDIEIVVPDGAEFATAIGAALCCGRATGAADEYI